MIVEEKKRNQYERNSVPALKKASQQSESMTGRMSEYAEECYRENPLSSTLVAFGVGAGVGLLIAAAIVRREQEQHRYFSELGRNVMNKVNRVVPSSIYYRT